MNLHVLLSSVEGFGDKIDEGNDNASGMYQLLLIK